MDFSPFFPFFPIFSHFSRGFFPSPNPLHPEDGAQRGAQRHAGRQGAAGGAGADGRGGHEGLFEHSKGNINGILMLC